MRRSLVLALAFALDAGLLAAPGLAQRAGQPAQSGFDSSPDPLRPYGTRSTGESASDPRAYSRSKVTPQPRPEPTPHPALRSRGLGAYYPTMRTGQGPNRNVVNPRSLCVPGRRAMLQR